MESDASMRNGLADHLRRHPHTGAMMVHPERRVLYMKAAKTAGTSIMRKTLEPQLPGMVYKKGKPDEFANWLENIDDAQLRDYFIFAVVRNPWDRFSSLAAYFDLDIRKLSQDFDELVSDNETLRIHAFPQVLYTHMDGTSFCDTIVRFEHLDEHMRAVWPRYGVEVAQVPHANRSRKRHYSHGYDAQLRDWVATKYADDIAAYGYGFEHAEKTFFDKIADRLGAR